MSGKQCNKNPNQNYVNSFFVFLLSWAKHYPQLASSEIRVGIQTIYIFTPFNSATIHFVYTILFFLTSIYVN